MLAAERGASVNTLSAYTRDLDALLAHLKSAGRDLSNATTDDLRGYLVIIERERLQSFVGGAPSFGDAAAIQISLRRGPRGDDPAAVLEGPKRGRTLPKVLSIKDVERLLDAARAGMNDESAKPAQRLRAARMSCLLEDAVRNRAARLRTDRAAGDRGAHQAGDAGDPRQRRQGTARAAQRHRASAR